MSAHALSKSLQHREHLVVSNRCADRYPDQRFGVAPGVGHPISSPLGTTAAQNHITINITNQPGASIDVAKIHDITSAATASLHGPPQTPAPKPLPPVCLGDNDLRRKLTKATILTPAGPPAPDLRPRTSPTNLVPSVLYCRDHTK